MLCVGQWLLKGHIGSGYTVTVTLPTPAGAYLQVSRVQDANNAVTWPGPL